MERSGRAHLLPDDIDTDQIIPGEYLNTVADDELGRYALVGYDPEFIQRIEPGDILVAGRNLGLGSSREAAPIALKTAGIGGIVAESVARIFYRNCINVGMPIAQVDSITDRVQSGDIVYIDFADGTVSNRTTGERYLFAAPPEFLLEILESGGLVEHRTSQ